MAGYTFNHPDFRDIDTPWEPAPIVWRFDGLDTGGNRIYAEGREASIPALIAQANDPSLTHLVREVDVMTQQGVSGLDLSVDQARGDLELVDAQFAQLEALSDIRVAPTQWHVFSDEHGLTRTLARVRIVEGKKRKLPDVETAEELASLNISEIDREILKTYLEGLDSYYEHTVGRPLDDIDRISQYKYGILRPIRGRELAGAALYLIDIEPILVPESYLSE